MVKAPGPSVMPAEDISDDQSILDSYHAGGRVSFKETLHPLPGIVNASDPKAFDICPKLIDLFVILDRHLPDEDIHCSCHDKHSLSMEISNPFRFPS